MNFTQGKEVQSPIAELVGRRIRLRGQSGDAPRRLCVGSKLRARTWDIPVQSSTPTTNETGWFCTALLPPEVFDVEHDEIVVGPAQDLGLISFPIGINCFGGQLEGIRKGRLLGWFGPLTSRVGSTDTPLFLSVDGGPLSASLARVEPVESVDEAPINPWDHFAIPLPSQVFDGFVHDITLFAGNERRIGTISYQMRVRGAIDRSEAWRLTGWIGDLGDGLDPAGFELHTLRGEIIPLRPCGLRQDVSAITGVALQGFDVRLSTRLDIQIDQPVIRHRDVADVDLIGAEAFVGESWETAALESLIVSLRHGTVLTGAQREYAINTLQDRLRRRRDKPSAPSLPVIGARPVRKPRLSVEQRRTVVVVPIFDGYQLAIDCLQALHAAVSHDPLCRVVVVDDYGPDQRLREELPAICSRYGFQLRDHGANRGFVESVNLVAAAFPHDDLLILNSDTVVPVGFVERMKAHLVKDPTIASVTPFSNAASIMSYPLINEERSLPEITAIYAADERFKARFGGISEDVPTGVGYCMLMRREALDRIGLFDRIWGKGYGEENDWCMRAAFEGYRHVAACDVFVGHYGAASFGNSKSTRIAQNLGILRTRYPDYDRRVQQFLEADPLARYRAEVYLEELVASGKPRQLLVTIALGGGIETYVDQRVERVRELSDVFVIKPKKNDPYAQRDHVELHRNGILETVIPLTDALYPALERFLGTCSLIELHSVVGVPSQLLDVLSAHAGNLTYVVHDYSFWCPRVTMTGLSGEYCQAPPISQCEICVEALGVHPAAAQYESHYREVSAWRAHHTHLLSRCQRVVAPSRDAQERATRLLSRPVDYESHEPSLVFPPVTFRSSDLIWVGIPGAISDVKGAYRLKAIAEDILHRNLPIRIHVIGYTAIDSVLECYKCLYISGRYTHADIPQIIQKHPLNVLAFLSIWPETYAYTLSEFGIFSIPSVCFDVGALAERIMDNGIGWTMPISSTSKDFCDAILSRFLAESRASQPDFPFKDPELDWSAIRRNRNDS